jgi:hypothetical protein
MNRTVAFFGTVGLGAVGMYLLDPTWGARRRGIVRDKLVYGVNRSSDGIAAASRELAHGMQMLLAETRARLNPERRAQLPQLTAGELDDEGALTRGLSSTVPQSNWSPAMRVACGGAGAVLLGYCLVRRTGSTAWLGAIGCGLLLAGANADQIRPADR